MAQHPSEWLQLVSTLIRPVRLDDAEAYRALRLKALREHPEAFGADYALNRARPIEYWVGMMAQAQTDNTRATFVAEHEGKLAGMMVIVRGDSPKTAHNANIYSVYVDPSARGHGLGDGLMRACLEWAERQAVRLLKLSVVASNASALKLYLRHGFVVYGVEPEALLVEGRYHDELLLVLRLQR
jgi:ribosomal protein S18 acetylase RimI-like enzyme